MRTTPEPMSKNERIPFDRLLAVDLRGLSKEQMDALTSEAIRRGCPISELLGQLINELAERYDLPGTYGAILFVILASVLFFAVLERVERWLRPVE